MTVEESDRQIGVLPGRRHPRRATPGSLRLHVGLHDAFPPAWRRIEVASDLGLVDLHDVLQVVFGWQDYHLHRFTTGPWDDPGTAFVCTADLVQGLEWDDVGSPPTWDVRVDELLAEPGERLFYNYDYGDNWWLVIEVEDVVDGARPPGRVELVEGAGAGPPEDCGGVDGYRLMVAAADPRHAARLGHAQPKRPSILGVWVRWIRPCCSSRSSLPVIPDGDARSALATSDGLISAGSFLRSNSSMFTKEIVAGGDGPRGRRSERLGGR